MKKKSTIIFTLLSTTFVFARLVDIHIPSSEELYIELMKERDQENRQAERTLEDRDSSEEDKVRAYNTLLDNGKRA